MNNLKVKWLAPWHQIEEEHRAEELIEELQQEIGEKHVLYSLPVKPIAYSLDCDDVLYQILDGSNRFAVVSLTYENYLESSPLSPETKIFLKFSDFEIQRMNADNMNWDN